MRRLVTLVAVVLLALGMTVPAGARGASTDTIRDFQSVVAVAHADTILAFC
jgi:hypothetical protein